MAEIANAASRIATQRSASPHALEGARRLGSVGWPNVNFSQQPGETKEPASALLTIHPYCPSAVAAAMSMAARECTPVLRFYPKFFWFPRTNIYQHLPAS